MKADVQLGTHSRGLDIRGDTESPGEAGTSAVKQGPVHHEPGCTATSPGRLVQIHALKQ